MCNNDVIDNTKTWGKNSNTEQHNHREISYGDDHMTEY